MPFSATSPQTYFMAQPKNGVARQDGTSVVSSVEVSQGQGHESDLTPPASIKDNNQRIMEILARAQQLKQAEEQQMKQQKLLEAQVSIPVRALFSLLHFHVTCFFFDLDFCSLKRRPKACTLLVTFRILVSCF
jgi:hypothetical protein